MYRLVHRTHVHSQGDRARELTSRPELRQTEDEPRRTPQKWRSQASWDRRSKVTYVTAISWRSPSPSLHVGQFLPRDAVYCIARYWHGNPACLPVFLSVRLSVLL